MKKSRTIHIYALLVICILFMTFCHCFSGKPILVTPAASTQSSTQVDKTPPIFQGITSSDSVSYSQIKVCWDPASDDVSAAENIQYAIYTSSSPGEQDFSTPSIITDPGTTCYTFDELYSGIEYYFVVRAIDEAGNIDENQIEKSASTKVDTTPPEFDGIKSTNELSPSEIEVCWDPALDDYSASQSIHYHLYVSLTSGNQVYDNPSYTTL